MGGRRLLARSGYRLGLRDRPDQPGPSGRRTGPAQDPGLQLLVGRQRLGELARARLRAAGRAVAAAPSPFDAARFDATARPAFGARRRRSARRREPGASPTGGSTARARRPDGRVTAPDRVVLAARAARRSWARRPGGPGGPRRPRRPRRPEGQAQGRLVAALDVEEGARRHRRRVRGVHPRPGRRLLLPGQLAPRSRPRSPPTSSTSPRPSTTATAQTVLGTIGTIDRQDLTISQIPKGLQDAVVSAEDRGFWTEGGISPTGILRAAYDDVTEQRRQPAGRLDDHPGVRQELLRRRRRHPADDQQEDQGDLHRAEAGRRRSPSTGSCRTT